MSKFILALDQGTTSSRAILFDKDQNIVAMSQREFTQIYPKDGWVEHDPVEIYSSQYSVMMEVIAKSGIFSSSGSPTSRCSAVLLAYLSLIVSAVKVLAMTGSLAGS